MLLGNWMGWGKGDCMDVNTFEELNSGDIVYHRGHPDINYLITDNFGSRKTAVRTVDLTNPDEWGKRIVKPNVTQIYKDGNPFRLDTKPFIDDLRHSLDNRMRQCGWRLEFELKCIKQEALVRMPDSYYELVSLQHVFSCLSFTDKQIAKSMFHNQKERL